MIEQLIIELSKRIKYIKPPNIQKITKVDNQGIHIETESSRDEYNRGKRHSPYVDIDFNFILNEWKSFTKERTTTVDKLMTESEKSTFILSYFAQLPFVELLTQGDKATIKLKEFKTDELPNEQYEKVITFLDEVKIGKYDSVSKSKVIYIGLSQEPGRMQNY